MDSDTLFLQVGLLVAINVGILATALVYAWRDIQRRRPQRGGRRRIGQAHSSR
jgi:hypothetical protein